MKTKNLELLTDEQRKFVKKQWNKHQHKSFKIDYDVSGEGDVLKGFCIDEGVWNPLIASGRYHARYFFYHSNLFQDKIVIEIGCGTGLVGVSMAKYGAKKVIMSDISPLAIKNTEKNVRKFGLTEKTDVIKSDLFEGIENKADLITWMIPFFPSTDDDHDTISASMLMSQKLFERFLIDAKKYLNAGGCVVIPSYDFGGSMTDPRVVALKFGYRVVTTWSHVSVNNLQRGKIHMHELYLD